ncbi:excalibur calcium-binding domain-containing protein [Nocardioides sp. SYSU D00038]|uniref:excalibur calcium-binding domain-containing protein n=1 Tax=Nocardioides sp. SYSU D00038 TaxID=2812554 RepID=UPI0019675B1F|nr:excalibur calcium-binding domain-containing protein [Nocardioides sp. SYSU D00038]
MRVRIAAFASLILALGALMGFVSASPAQARDANCTDFDSQAAAQNYFLNHGGPHSDPDGLDSDGDGVACESNPCPCNNSTGGGGGGGDGHAGGGAKKKHNIQVRGEEVRNTNRFRAVGKVTTYKGQRIQIQRNIKKRGWRYLTRTRTKPGTGKFRVPIAGPKGSCFRVMVPATRKYRRTYKDFGCIR